MFLDSGKCLGFWEVLLDSGKCFGSWEVFWILGSVLDSRKCFVPMGHRNEEPKGKCCTFCLW